MTIKHVLLTSALCVTMIGAASAQEARYLFTDLDMDNDGFVTLAELEAGFDTGVGSDAAPAAVLETQDADGDMMISLAEAGSDMAIYTAGPEEASADDDD